MRLRSSSARKARLFAIHSPVATTMVISDAIAIAHCCLRDQHANPSVSMSLLLLGQSPEPVGLEAGGRRTGRRVFMM